MFIFIGKYPSVQLAWSTQKPHHDLETATTTKMTISAKNIKWSSCPRIAEGRGRNSNVVLLFFLCHPMVQGYKLLTQDHGSSCWGLRGMRTTWDPQLIASVTQVLIWWQRPLKRLRNSLLPMAAHSHQKRDHECKYIYICKWAYLLLCIFPIYCDE